MKAMKKWFAGIIMLTLMFGISFAGTAAASASGHEVRLIDSRIFTYKYGYVEFSGSVEVENLGYAKQVSVHYSTDNVNWYDTSASYVGPTDGAHEKWNFQISTSAMTTDHPELKNLTSIQFAIKYEVNGNTYWDNNGGANYTNSPYFGNGTTSVILGKPNVLLGFGYLTNDSFYGYVYVKNLNPAKTVKIRYTTDNWATYTDGYATYNGPSNGYNSVEGWSFSFNVPGAAQVKYAVGYTVNGTTYWDSNYGNNYTANGSAMNP